MKYHSLFTPLLISVIFLGAGCQTNTSSQVIPAPVPVATTPPPPLPPPITFPEDPSPFQPRPAGTVCDTKNFICVDNRVVNAHFSPTISATGTAVAFESTFQWKLTNNLNIQVATGVLMANAPDIGQPGTFTLSYTPALPAGPYTLTFYESSAKDGTPIHILAIPISL